MHISPHQNPPHLSSTSHPPLLHLQVLLINVADMTGRLPHFSRDHVNMLVADVFAVAAFILGCMSTQVSFKVWGGCGIGGPSCAFEASFLITSGFTLLLTGCLLLHLLVGVPVSLLGLVEGEEADA